MRSDLPTGTVTFLFTDIEGSTRLLHELGPEGYAAALAEHRRVLRDAFARHGGAEVDTQGDAFFVAFPTATGALAAASDASAGLGDGPIAVRIGVHTGTPLVTEEGYVGADVHRAARIAGAAHGGQVVVSASTAALAGDVALQDLGDHRFKDLAAPERVYQLGSASFPPLRSLYRTNLPVPATPFIGRAHEVREVARLAASPHLRLLTLTGPGGTGKTRLALQAAAEAAEAFPDGVVWLALAPLTEASVVVPALAEAIGVGGRLGGRPAHELARALRGKRTGLVLDNAEHLLPALADELSPLVEEPGPTLIVTSRARLDLPGEHVFPVDPLADDEAVALFAARARAAGVEPGDTAVVAQLCRRLDNLPLAVELAAARAALFSAEQLLERIGQRLDLLKGGRRAEARQQTLRATIGWSHDLLDGDERRLFRRLAVFAGGCTYEAAEEICEADADTLQSLLAKSLLRRRDTSSGPRYWMLETIREFAADELDRAGERDGVAAAHAEWCAARGVGLNQAVRSFDTAATAALLDELPNLRVALAYALDRGDVLLAGDLLLGLWFIWLTRGYGREAAEAVDRWLALDRAALEPADRVPGLLAAGEIVRFTGDTRRAAGLKRELADILRAEPEAQRRGWLFERTLAATLSDLANVMIDWDAEGAERHADEALALRRKFGDPRGVAHALHAVGEVLFVRGAFAESRLAVAEARDLLTAAGVAVDAAEEEAALARCDIYLGDLAGARRFLQSALAAMRDAGDLHLLTYAIRLTAVHAAATGHVGTAARLVAASDRALEEGGVRVASARERELEDGLLAPVRAAFRAEWDAGLEEGRALDQDDALAIALEYLQHA